jgi:methionyl-tRNA synthetase
VVRPCRWPDGTSRWLAAAAGTAAGGAPDWPEEAGELRAVVERTPAAVRAALADFDFRVATAGVWRIVEEANRFVDASEPWHLARAERAGDRTAGRRLDAVLGALIAACQVLAAEIWPFLPDLAARIAAACNDSAGVLPQPRPLFPRIEARQYPATATVPPANDRKARSAPALSAAGTGSPGYSRERDRRGDRGLSPSEADSC